MMKNYLLALITLLATAWTASAQTVVDIHGQLQVEGANIKDACGRNTQLKGMSYFWHQWPGSEYWNANAVGWLASDWKVEIVRAAMGVRGNDCCDYFGDPEGSKAQVRAVVNGAIEHGIYVIIDWHAHGMHTAEAKAFFVEMAQEFGQYPNVIYEIYNEPTGSSWENLDQTWPQLKEYSRELIAAIRQHDPDNLIICPTPFYDQFVHQAAADPITVDKNNNPVSNIAYTLHIYADAHRFDGAQGNWAREALSKGLPMFVTESGATGTTYNEPRSTGINAPNYTEWAKWENWWDQNNIGYCKWSLSNKDEFGSSLLPQAPATGNWDYNNHLTDEGRWNRDHFRAVNSRATVCGSDNPGTGSGNVIVRARGTSGSEQIEIRYQDQRVGNLITLSTTFQEYKVQVNNANGNFKVAFVNDNGNRDVYVDWLQVGATKRQAESRANNTGAWANGVCGGGTKTEVMHCNGYIGFGTMSDATTGSIVVRAKGDTGTETMVLQINGQDVKTWTNVSTSFTNYTYNNYSGSGTIKVRYTNDGYAASGADRNLTVDRITVCGQVIQANASGVTRNGCGQGEWLWCNGNFDFGTVGCGSARTTGSTTKAISERLDEANDLLKTYPNPASGSLTVAGTGDYQMALYDLSGRSVMQHDHLEGTTNLDIRHIRPGVYVMKLRDAEQHEVRRRIIIE